MRSICLPKRHGAAVLLLLVALAAAPTMHADDPQARVSPPGGVSGQQAMPPQQPAFVALLRAWIAARMQQLAQ